MDKTKYNPVMINLTIEQKEELKEGIKLIPGATMSAWARDIVMREIRKIIKDKDES
jgi:hypothetical protein